MTNRSTPAEVGPDRLSALGGLADTKPGRAHLIGVNGSGMKAAAELLLARGWQLSGSDLSAPGPGMLRLVSQGLRVCSGHEARWLTPGTSLVIYSPAVPAHNPERVRATELGLAQLSYPEFLASQLAGRAGVCIAGTHGKSTTTALLGHVLIGAGRSPLVMIGASRSGDGRSGIDGSGPLAVMEACEYRRHFWQYSTRYGCVLNVEPDHFDSFPQPGDLEAAFAGFVSRIDPAGFCVVSEAVPQVARSAARCRLVQVGTQSSSDWCLTDSVLTGSGSRFQVRHKRFDGTWDDVSFELGLPGQHNLQNALAVIAMAGELGVPLDVIQRELRTFTGIGRRFERLPECAGVQRIDDYAHHPTAVAAGLRAARLVTGPGKLWCVFQPHQTLRLQRLLGDFAASLSLSDEVLLAPVFAAREEANAAHGQLVEQLVSQIIQRGVPARAANSLDHVLAILDDELQPGDVLLTMGAGDIDRIQYAIARRIQRHSAAGRSARATHLAQTGRTRPVLPDTTGPARAAPCH